MNDSPWFCKFQANLHNKIKYLQSSNDKQDQKKSAEFELSCFAKTSNPKRYTHTQAPKYHTQP